MEIVLALVFLFLVGATGVVIFVSRASMVESKALRRLRQLGSYIGHEDELKTKKLMKDDLDEPFYDRVIKPILVGMEKRMSGRGRAEKDRELQDLLIMAGNPGNLTPGQFRALKILLMIVSSSICTLLFVILGLNMRFLMLFLVVPIMGSLVMPMFILKKKVTTRQKLVKRAIPDCLDLLTVSVEAGLGFDQAVSKYVEKVANPLAEEFNRMLQEVKMGKQRRDSLRDMATRVKIEELDTFISSIIQADTLGVSIANVLRIQSEQIRIKRRQEIEEQAMKAPLKMLFPMILFIFPTIFIVVFGPIGIYVYKELAKYGMV